MVVDRLPAGTEGFSFELVDRWLVLCTEHYYLQVTVVGNGDQRPNNECYVVGYVFTVIDIHDHKAK